MQVTLWVTGLGQEGLPWILLYSDSFTADSGCIVKSFALMLPLRTLFQLKGAENSFLNIYYLLILLLVVIILEKHDNIWPYIYQRSKLGFKVSS